MIEHMLMRASCFFVMSLALMIVYVFGDIWRIERRVGKPLSAIAIGMLAAVCLFIAVMFGRCALTGRYPQPPEGACQ